MQPFFTENFYNPSASYSLSRAVKQDISEARRKVAFILGAKPSEIIFTAGATEANNIAIHGVMARYPGKKVAYSAIEHDSVRSVARQFDSVELPVLGSGLLDYDSAKNLLNDEVVLVSVILANNEIGTVQSVRRLNALIDEVKQNRSNRGVDLPLYVHMDGAQAANYLDLHVSRLGVDLLTLNGGKMYGPKQSGALFIKSGIVLEPITFGGGQERSLRSGTENVPAIVGFSHSLELAQDLRQAENERLLSLQKLFLDLVADEPRITLNGSLQKRLPNNLHISIDGIDNERFVIQLDNKGYQVATGSACSASRDEPSHVLKAIGLDERAIRSSLRITMGRPTTESSVRGLVDSVRSLLA